MTRGLRRFEGRLFAEDGCLFLVVQTDLANETARVSCRVDGHTQVVDMPLHEVASRVSSGAALILDNLNAPESTRRVVRSDDGWFFTSREGEQGPFESAEQARQALVRYILRMQTAAESVPRQPRASGRRRGERAVSV